MRCVRWLLLALAAALAVATPALADDNRPLIVSVTDLGGGTDRDYRLVWKLPANVEARHLPALEAGGGCRPRARPRNWSDPMGHWREERWHCPAGLIGRPVVIAYPRANPNLATIVRHHRGGGAEPQTLLLQPQDRAFTLARTEAERGGFRDFLLLGIEHIWIGFDHLLFVAGLIFIAGTPRRVLATVTGFTIAHSITLALAATGLVTLPIAAIEAVIALSIVFLAVEIAKGPRDTLSWCQPIIVASVFGLLHGFGFAAVLGEIGLPRQGLVAALLAFNLGIEIGQILFAGCVMLALRLLARAMPAAVAGAPARRIAGYGVGIVASFWMFERMLA